MKLLIKPWIAATFLFYIQSYAQQDPNINHIMNNVDGNSLALFVRELSGEVQTVVNGTAVRILSRYAEEPGNIIAADYIAQKLVSYGYTVINQNDQATCRNVYATLTGTTEPQKKYILCAHYDSQIDWGSTAIAPGADDNASGVAVVLEAARILKAYAPKYTIVFALFDEEEIDLIGSQYYASHTGSNTLGAINMDMLGYDSDSDYKIDIHVRNVGQSSTLSNAVNYVNTLYHVGCTTYVRNPGTDESDQYSFWDQNYSAIGLLEDEEDFNEDYHTTSDRFSLFNAEYFLRCAKLAIGTLAYLSLPPNGSTLVDSEREVMGFRLDQNYPNPFNPTTTIRYSVPEQGYVTITVYDASGKEVALIVNADKSIGEYAVEFNATNLSNGIYFYQMRMDEFIQTKKMMVLK